MFSEIHVQLGALASVFESAEPVGLQLERARAVFVVLERQEGRHVREALRDESFAFSAAQEQLAGVRREFASLCRELVRRRADALGARQRRELLDMAYLVKCAPLTDPEDLTALRRARASGRLAVAS